MEVIFKQYFVHDTIKQKMLSIVFYVLTISQDIGIISP